MALLWELTAALGTRTGGYTYADRADLVARTFASDGSPKHWPTRPTLIAGVEPGRKKPYPIPAFGHIELASLVLQPNVVSVLGDFLCQFGELLDVEYAGGLVYFYNVTKLVSCVDVARSTMLPTGGAIMRPAFHPDAVPQEPLIFKDPLTAKTRLYATTAAKAYMEPILKQHRLAGLTFYEAGAY